MTSVAAAQSALKEGLVTKQQAEILTALLRPEERAGVQSAESNSKGARRPTAVKVDPFFPPYLALV